MSPGSTQRILPHVHRKRTRCVIKPYQVTATADLKQLFIGNTAMKIEGKVAQDDVYLEYKDTTGSAAPAPAAFDRTYIWRKADGNNRLHRCNNMGARLLLQTIGMLF